METTRLIWQFFKKIWRSCFPIGDCPICHEQNVLSNIKAFEGDHVVSEFEVRCSACGIVGYWAFGSFDPSLPYQGSAKESRHVKTI